MTDHKNKNLYAIADDLLERSLNGWQGNTPAIITLYDLTEQQATTVKRHTKKLAASRFLIWGWQPSIEKFRVAPTENALHIASEMIEYTYYHVALQVGDLYHLLPGAERSGYLTSGSAERTRRKNNSVQRRLREIYNSIDFND